MTILFSSFSCFPVLPTFFFIWTRYRFCFCVFTLFTALLFATYGTSFYFLSGFSLSALSRTFSVRLGPRFPVNIRRPSVLRSVHERSMTRFFFLSSATDRATFHELLLQVLCHCCIKGFKLKMKSSLLLLYQTPREKKTKGRKYSLCFLL